MRDFSVLSRRDVLRMAGAVGGLVVTGVGQIRAQSAKKIESMAPELDRIISTGEPIRELASGFGGDIGPAEGPVWWAEGHYLLFNDIQTARRMKYTPGGLSAQLRLGGVPWQVNGEKQWESIEQLVRQPEVSQT